MKIKKILEFIIFIFIIFIIVIWSIIVAYKILPTENGKLVSKWNKYSNKPILGDEGTGTLFDPYVMKDESGKYRMYVSYRRKGAIAVTTSEDGINWGSLEIVLERDNTTGWEDIVNRATVIYKDGKYYMWYTGQTNNISKIGYAVSEDGYVFERNKEPVLIPEENYEKQSVMNPYVIYDEEEQIFKMWYATGETYEPDVISYATSNDGIHWNKYENNPIIKANKHTQAKDNFKVGACEIHKIDDEYIMFYIGYTDINTARIFVAKSKDGIINWERYSQTPIIEPTKGTFDESACYKPTVLWDIENKRWMLWYNGRNKENEYIGLATSNEYDFLK